MELSTLIYINIFLSVVTVLFCVFLAVRMNLIKYLLEQPAVKKMSPKMKLKPYRPPERASEPSSRSGASAERNQKSGNREGRDNRGRGDRNRSSRPPRNRGARSEYPNRTGAGANPAAETPVEKKEGTPGNETSGTSQGRRPLTPESRPEPVSTPVERRNENTQGSEIQHGRRARTKKAPTFED